jgi:hypothetical protein
VSKVQELESTVKKLSREELAAFRAWFAEFDADIWDREIEEDVAADVTMNVKPRLGDDGTVERF